MSGDTTGIDKLAFLAAEATYCHANEMSKPNKVIIPGSGFDTRMVDELAAAETIDMEAEFEAINELKAEIAYQARGIDDDLARLMELRQKVAGPYDEAIKFHTQNIENAVLLDAKSFKCPYGKATYRRESERSSWDNKALMGYAAAHPEIEQFRKVTPVKALVSISFDGDGQ